MEDVICCSRTYTLSSKFASLDCSLDLCSASIWSVLCRPESGGVLSAKARDCRGTDEPQPSK